MKLEEIKKTIDGVLSCLPEDIESLNYKGTSETTALSDEHIQYPTGRHKLVITISYNKR